MNIIEATRQYENWLGGLTALVPQDLALKHRLMREEAFAFFRATYYRWAQVWPRACPELAGDARALAVGDLHVENFGTWRDAEGRLVWGVNDFDECHPLAFSNDLVRLAVSAGLAIEAGELSLSAAAAATEILRGYTACLKAGGRPVVLADTSAPLREMARHRLATPERFWNKMRGHPRLRGRVPRKIRRLMAEMLPEAGLKLTFVHRVAGLGSLGKERFTGVGWWLGGGIVREVKALTPSACDWVEGKKGGKIHYDKILRRAVRVLDPLVAPQGKWLVRRLSPDCFRLPLDHLPKQRNERDLLFFMGWETANIHLGSVPAPKLRRHLGGHRENWLRRAMEVMQEETLRDWKRWKGR